MAAGPHSPDLPAIALGETPSVLLLGTMIRDARTHGCPIRKTVLRSGDEPAIFGCLSVDAQDPAALTQPGYWATTLAIFDEACKKYAVSACVDEASPPTCDTTASSIGGFPFVIGS